MKKLISVVICLALFLSATAVFAVPAGAAIMYTGACGDNLTCTLDTSDWILTVSGTGDMYDFGLYNENGAYSSSAPWKDYVSKIRTIKIGSGVTSIGSFAFFGCVLVSEMNIPSSVKKIGTGAFYGCRCIESITIPNGVTEIADYTFCGCTRMTGITIPASVKTFGTGAFDGCTNLSGVYISDLSAWCGLSFEVASDNPLHYAKNLYLDGTLIKYLIIPSNVTKIGESVFDNCTSLKSITIPKSVKKIEDWAFSGCYWVSGLYVDSGNTVYRSRDNCIIETATKKLVLGCSTSVIPADGSVTSIGDGAFCGCITIEQLTIPECVTSIGEGAFANCTALRSFDLPSSLTTIGDDAFYGCSSFAAGTFPSSLTYIGNEAFYGCNASINVVLPESLRYVGDMAFANCPWIINVSIPKDLEQIGNFAFCMCKRLESITVDDGNKVYNSNGNCLMETETGILLTGCKDGFIPSDGSVIAIGNFAFSGYDRLKSVKIPDSVIVIGSFAFADCAWLGAVEIPESVIYIGEGAFYNCETLKWLLIGSSVQYIGEKAADGSWLEDVFYCGSEEDWNNVYVESDNSKLDSAAYHYDIDPQTGTVGGRCGDGLTWEFCFGSGTISITGVNDPSQRGNMDNYKEEQIGSNGKYKHCTTAPWSKYSEEITAVEIGYGVGTIGNSAFRNCQKLSSVVIENGPRKIGEYAFAGCALLTDIDIPDSVTSIGSAAFRDCSSLKKVSIGDGVESIGNRAFCYCTSLTEIYTGYGAKTIEAGAFIGCSSLITAEIGYNVTTIDKDVFRACRSLTTMYIGNGVNSIGSSSLPTFNNLKDIYYAGSEEEWESIKTPYDSESLNNVTVHYNSVLPSYFEPGDVTGDGYITMSDVLMLRKNIAGILEFTEEQIKRADMDGDGEVTMSDVLIMRKMIAGIIKI